MFSLTVPEFLALLFLWRKNEKPPFQPFHVLDDHLSSVHLLIHWQLESQQHFNTKVQMYTVTLHN